MLKTFMLDGNKKLILKNYKYKMTSTYQEYVREKLILKFYFVLGEYWLDITKGVPYFDKEDGEIAIFKKGADITTIEATLKEYILDTEYVAEILSFTFSIDNLYRNASISWEIKLTNDEITSGAVTI